MRIAVVAIYDQDQNDLYTYRIVDTSTQEKSEWEVRNYIADQYFDHPSVKEYAKMKSYGYDDFIDELSMDGILVGEIQYIDL